MMELKYAHIADYAGEGARGKPMVIGIFDQINVAAGATQISTPPMCVIAAFETTVTQGSQHHVLMQMVDPDGQPVIPPLEGDINFVPTGPMRPLRAVFILQFGPMPLADVGDFSFDIFVDGKQLGSLPLHVSRLP